MKIKNFAVKVRFKLAMTKVVANAVSETKARNRLPFSTDWTVLVDGEGGIFLCV